MSGTPSVSRRYIFTAAIGAASVSFVPALASPPPRQQPAPIRTKPPPLRTIMLDPGHGGSDPGAIAISGTYEKSVVLGFSQLLERNLLATGRYRVVQTRRGDSFVALRRRVELAKGAKADLFVSLHADWHPDGDTRGASVYTLSEEASDRESAALAQRENRAGALGGVDLRRKSDSVAEVLISMAQRGTVNASRRFADITVESFEQQHVQVLPRAHRQAGFAVLTAADIPAALVELGYLSNRSDAKLLLQRDHQQRLALCLTQAIDRYFAVAAASPAAKKT